jgi:hypothetical protein
MNKTIIKIKKIIIDITLFEEAKLEKSIVINIYNILNN